MYIAYGHADLHTDMQTCIRTCRPAYGHADLLLVNPGELVSAPVVCIYNATISMFVTSVQSFSELTRVSTHDCQHFLGAQNLFTQKLEVSGSVSVGGVFV